MLRLLSGEGCLGCGANACHVLLNAFQKIESGTWACTVPLGLQAHAHDAVEDEGQEADHGMGADAIGEPVVDRCDLDVGFEHAEAALDVRQTPVACDRLCGSEVRGVCDQREPAVEELGFGECVFVDRPTEAVGVKIGLEEAREFGLGDSPGEPGLFIQIG